MNIAQILTTVAWACSFIMTAYMAYFLIIAVFSVKKPREYPEAEPRTRFAVLVAARNEEAVIGNLVESLMNQDYPKELYDVIVIPNNCTDNTAEAARAHGAAILDCTVPVRSKGEVMTFAVQTLLDGEKPYDSIVVFDADNLVHPLYLREMNNAVAAGVRVAQAYRDSKNPHDTLMSGAYSIYYWMVNQFYSQARSGLNLSAVVNGSGFMVELDLLRQWGGWHTQTMTEDIEFTAQCALHGQKVAWVPKAITFDEQPLTFAESWKQRKRWSTGSLQCMERYSGRLARSAVKGNPRSLDSLLFFLGPVIQVLWLVSLLLGLGFQLMGVDYGFFPATGVFYQLFFSVTTSFLGTFAAAFLSVLLTGNKVRPMLGAMCYYWVFVTTWIPINLLCMVRKTTAWEQMSHTRAIRPAQLFGQ